MLLSNYPALLSDSLILIQIAIFVVAFGFVFLAPLLLTPVTEGGVLVRRLCLLNAAGWLVIVPTALDTAPFLFVFAVLLFWGGNLILLPAALVALRKSSKDGPESSKYLAVTSSYLFANVCVLFVLPMLWFLWRLNS